MKEQEDIFDPAEMQRRVDRMKRGRTDGNRATMERGHPDTKLGFRIAVAAMLLWSTTLAAWGTSPSKSDSSATKELTYATLTDLIQDLRYNEIRRERIVNKDLDNLDVQVIVIKNVRVESVMKDADSGVTVMTYEIAKNSLQLCAVYVKDLMAASKLENLRHDDHVAVIGVVFAYGPAGTKDIPAEGIRVWGVVRPVPNSAQRRRTK